MLSEKKKTARREKILSRALEAFGELGFERCTMAEIAKRAGTAVGTAYNYFDSKGDILLALISTRSEAYVGEMDELMPRTDLSDTDKLRVLAGIYLRSLGVFSKRVWREFMAFAFSAKPELFGEIRRIDEPFIECLSSLYGGARARLLYHSWIYRLFDYLADDGASPETLAEGLIEDTLVSR